MDLVLGRSFGLGAIGLCAAEVGTASSECVCLFLFVMSEAGTQQGRPYTLPIWTYPALFETVAPSQTLCAIVGLLWFWVGSRELTLRLLQLDSLEREYTISEMN